MINNKSSERNKKVEDTIQSIEDFYDSVECNNISSKIHAIDTQETYPLSIEAKEYCNSDNFIYY